MRVVAVIFFLGGPVLGLLAGVLARGLENKNAAAALGEAVSERAALLERETFSVTEALYHTRAFFDSSRKVTREGFRDFTRDILTRHPVIATIDWSPYITEKERANHERGARAEGLTEYRISNLDPKRVLAPAPPKADYYPIYYRESADQSRSILGLDLSSDPVRRAVLKRAIEGNRLGLTDPILAFPREENRRTWFLAVLPVYDHAGGSGERGAQSHRGVIGILIWTRKLFLRAQEVAKSHGDLEPYFELVDEDVKGKAELIAATSEGEADPRYLALTQSVRMELGEQQWRLSGRPTQAFMDQHLTAQPYLLGTGVFIFWCLLGGLTLVLTNRSHDMALRKQGLVYESAVRSLSEGVIVANTDGRFILFNPAAQEILGIGAQDVAVSGWTAAYGCYLPDKVTPFPPERLPLARALKGERATEEIYIRNEAVPDGAWISTNGAPITNERGLLIGGIVNFRDISKMKASSESLRLSIKELKDLKYAVDEATVVSITSLDGGILYVNDNFCEICGYAAEELIGQNHRILRSGNHPAVFFEELWKTVRAGGIWRGVIRNRAKSGELYCVDTTIVPLLNDAGQCERYLGMSTDVTASKQQEQKLQLLSNAVEQTADAVFITDAAGIISYVNPAFESITGYTREDAWGKSPRILKSGTNPDAYYEELWRTILGGNSFRSVTINRKKNGHLFEAEQTITPIKDSAGTISNFVSVVKDITDRVMRQRQEIEMRYAAQVQQQLYPARAVDIHGYDIAGASFSAEFACGDYYDYLEPRNGSLCLALGDVSGHGLAPAMIMTATRSYLRFLVRSQTDLGVIMSSINEALYADLERSRFVALLLVSIDLTTKTLSYVNAGLTEGFVLDETGGVKAVLSNSGPPLGLVSDVKYRACQNVALEAGDTVVLMTDGVTEAQDRLENFFEPERALAVVRAHRHESAKEIVQELYDEVRKFSQDAPQLDDITAIVCKVGETEMA